MPKLKELFEEKGLNGQGTWEKPFNSEKLEDTKEDFGKPVSFTVDKFNSVTVGNYRVDYLNKEGNVILHFYVKTKWPLDFIDKVRSNIEGLGDSCECDFVMEMNSWFVLVSNFSVRRFGSGADATYISSILEDI